MEVTATPIKKLRGLRLKVRRSCRRFPIAQPVRYKIQGGRKGTEQIGLGNTLNISSSGVLFTTEPALSKGLLIELAVNWPVTLGGVRLELIVWGQVVRADELQAAMSIERYEFKTRRSGPELSRGILLMNAWRDDDKKAHV